jgi:FSR family fosmidomycin resistance protein-like MFS transporter
MILTSVSGQFELSVSQIGLGAMIYTLAAALTQPLFGIVADRWRGRWLGAIGLLWTMVFFGLAAFAPTYPLMVACLTVGALGSGAFHPVGLINAGASGGRYPTTATSVFFVLGQSGLAIGPIVSGILLQRMGLASLPWMALAMTPAVIMLALYLREPIPEGVAPGAGQATPRVASAGTPATAEAQRSRALIVAAFVLLIALRATTTQSFATLLPKYFDDLGYSSAAYGTLIGIFAFAGAVGTFIGGYLGDRFKRRHVIFVSMVLSAPFSYALLHASGWAYLATAAMAGALLNIPHSILLVMAQALLPKRKGLMGGAVLGFMFASGAATAWLASWFADIYGLQAVLTVLAFFPIGAGLCALVLPSTRPARLSTPVSADPAAAD